MLVHLAKRVFLGCSLGVVFTGFSLCLPVDEHYQEVASSKPRPFYSAIFSRSAFSSKRLRLDTSDVSKRCVDRLGGLERVVHDMAEESNVDPRLIMAVMHVESRCNVQSISPRGAVGLMQVLPSTARLMGVSNPSHPKENIRAGARYLGTLQGQFGSDLALTIAAYNAGPGSVKKFRGVPPYPETQRYVRDVIKAYNSMTKNTQRQA